MLPQQGTKENELLYRENADSLDDRLTDDALFNLPKCSRISSNHHMHRLLPTLVVFAAVSVAFHGTSVSATTKFKGLADADTKFATFLKAFVVPQDNALQELLTVLEPLDSSLPWLSTCVAAIDPISIYASVSLSSGFAACNASINNFTMPANLTDDAVRTSVCPFYGVTLMPCVNKVLVQAVVDAMESSGGRCDEMKTEIKKLFGADLQSVAADALTKLGAVMCTVKTFKTSTGATKTEACLTSLFQSFMGPTTAAYILPLVQLPTEQACKAVTAQPFTTTLNAPEQFRWSALGVDAVGICYEPLSELFKMVSAYPMMAKPLMVNGTTTAIAMVDAFTPDKCMLLEKALQWLQDQDSVLMQWARVYDGLVEVIGVDTMGSTGMEDDNITTILQTVLREAQTGMPPVCIHLANGQKCDYGGATTSLSYQSTTNSFVSPASKSISDASLVTGAAIVTIASLISLSGM
jgi:hypothetical protein